MTTAEDIIIRARDLAEAINHAHAITVTEHNYREVRALTSTLARIHQEATALGEPEGDDTVGGDL